jgi:hypothetical protein
MRRVVTLKILLDISGSCDTFDADYSARPVVTRN